MARTTFAGGVRVNHSEHLGVNITASDTNVDETFYAMRIDHNVSGSQTATADRTHAALFLDVDSSATGGDTSDEHRLYGLYADVRASGDSDLVYGGQFFSRTDNFGDGNQVTNLRGVNAHTQPNHDAGHIGTTIGVAAQAQNLSSGTGSAANNWGVYGLATAQSTSSYTSTSYIGVYGLAQAHPNNVPSIGSLAGVRGEVQLDNRTLSAITISNAYCVLAIFDENDADDTGYTVNNSYLFYGDYQGQNLATNRFGVFISDDVENRFAGRVRAKEFDVGGTLIIDASRNLQNIVDGTFTGELKVGTSDSTVYNNSTGTGVVLGLDASIQAARANDAPLLLNRQGSDGSIAVFYKNGSSVGTVGVDSGDNLYIASTTANHAGLYLSTNVYAPLRAGSLLDDAISFGNSTYRYKDLQLSGTAYAGELIIGQNSGLSGTQVYIKKKDNSTNLQRWGEGTSGASTYRFRIDQNFKFIANSGSGDNFTLHSDSGNLTGVGTIASGSIIATGTSPTNPVLETVSPTNGGAPIFRAGTEDFLGVLIGTQGGGFSVESNNYFAIWHQPYANRGSQNNLTERFHISSGGNVGINTGGSTPKATLHVVGPSARPTNLASVDTASTAQFQADSSNAHSLYIAENASGALIQVNDGATNSTSAKPLALQPFGGEVGIGTGVTAPTEPLTVSKTASGSTTQIASFVNPVGTASTGVRLWLSGTNTTSRGTFIDAVAESTSNDHTLRFGTSAGASAPTERARLDADGNFIVGKEVNNTFNEGFVAKAAGGANITSAGGTTLELNRRTSNGTLLNFRKDNSTVGSIGTVSTLLTIGKDATGIIFNSSSSAIYPWNLSSNTGSNGLIDLGFSDRQWKDLRLAGNVIVGGTTVITSARNLTNIGTGTFSGTITTTGSLIGVNAIVDNVIAKTTNGNILFKTNAGASIARFNNDLTADFFNTITSTGNIVGVGINSTANFTELGSTSSSSLVFKRNNASYIQADQTGGYFIFITNGRSTSYANLSLIHI